MATLIEEIQLRSTFTLIAGDDEDFDETEADSSEYDEIKEEEESDGWDDIEEEEEDDESWDYE